MTAFADLEIGLHRRDAESYAVELRTSQPEDEAGPRLIPGTAHFDIEQLRAMTLDTAAYGELLGKNLFNEPSLLTEFGTARSIAQSRNEPLRARLYIGPSAPELHSVRWETLRDPQHGVPLFTSEQILFSRYLSSLDWRPVRLRARKELRALVVIVNPVNLVEYQLAPIDVEGELERAKDGLGRIPVTQLAAHAKATLNNLCAQLRDEHDILYLVCHGALIKGEPVLYLENDAGKVNAVHGSELVNGLGDLPYRPRLVVLASCQSAGTGAERSSSDGGAQAALGPRLAEAGIPAVLAMQGNITMETVERFMPRFFQELQRDGQIDRAMAVARNEVRNRPDHWMPVLFMRLRSGRIWYEPGFADERQGFERWPALLRSIRQGRCTPILGPGLTESLLGSSREIAHRWSETYHFPMAPHEREDLPHVAQFLAVNQGQPFPRDELAEYLRREILHDYGEGLQADVRNSSLDQLIETVGAQRRECDLAEPHRVLAQLPFPIYITTNPDTLLESNLASAGKDPHSELCRWNSDLEMLPSIYDKEVDYRPDAQRPLVYHLFGRLSQPESLVLTEDDYFDYLIGVTSNKDLIPVVVRRALADTALLFLGFRLDDWNFRVLFRSVMSQEGGGRRTKYAHVAAQINPEEGRILNAERARRYLESYFQGSRISIYWGSVEDLMKDLLKQSQEGTA